MPKIESSLRLARTASGLAISGSAVSCAIGAPQRRRGRATRRCPGPSHSFADVRPCSLPGWGRTWMRPVARIRRSTVARLCTVGLAGLRDFRDHGVTRLLQGFAGIGLLAGQVAVPVLVADAEEL